MKRFLSLLLSLIMCLSLCSFSNAESEKTVITAMCWGSKEGLAEDFNRCLELYAPELAEKYTIEYLVGDNGSLGNAEKIRFSLAAGEPIADMVQLNYAQVPEFARAGALYDLGEAIAPYEDLLNDAGKAITQWDGKYLMVVSNAKPKVWYYRADIFEECGVNVEEIKNTDDLIAAGLKIQEKYPDSYIANLGHTPGDYSYFCVLSGNGARCYDENGNYNISTDAPTIAMLEDYKKMVDAGVVMDVSDWTTDWESALANGQLVSQLSANWLGNNQFLPTYSGEANKGKWACRLWPEIAGSKGGSDMFGSVYVIPTSAAHPAEAAELMCFYFLSTNGFLSKWQNVDHCMRPLKAMQELSDDGTLLEGLDDSYFGTSWTEACIKAMDEIKVYPYSPNASAEIPILIEYFTKAVYGEMTIEDALKAAENDLNTLIGNAFE